jgi:hypothetical protein
MEDFYIRASPKNLQGSVILSIGSKQKRTEERGCNAQDENLSD